ncbi:hypothetical protein Bca101_015321 [Brassica carinata]
MTPLLCFSDRNTLELRVNHLRGFRYGGRGSCRRRCLAVEADADDFKIFLLMSHLEKVVMNHSIIFLHHHQHHQLIFLAHL